MFGVSPFVSLLVEVILDYITSYIYREKDGEIVARQIASLLIPKDSTKVRLNFIFR